MRINYVYNIVVNDIIVYTCTSIKTAMEAFNEIRKNEPKAWLQTIRG